MIGRAGILPCLKSSGGSILLQIGGAREEWNFFGAPKWKYREGEQRGWCKPMGLPGNTSPFEGCEKVLLAHGMCGPNTCTPFPFGKGVGWRQRRVAAQLSRTSPSIGCSARLGLSSW